MARVDRIARTVVYAILRGKPEAVRSFLYRFYLVVAAFFTICPRLVPFRDELFRKLREQWRLKPGEYESSFEGELSMTGDMGYSGSTFFTTSDGKYLVKSVPRGFEHSFFRDDFLLPYFHHMDNHPGSILIRITDFLAWQYYTIGLLFGLAPSYHIVMENLLTGQEEATGKKWETFDLKPTSYFYPERDVAGGRLASEATKSRLADDFDDSIILTQEQADDLIEKLELDTRLLEESNAVDYSLFLVRIPLDLPQSSRPDNAPEPPEYPPFAPPNPPTWRTGVKSPDGKYVYRLAILDFFWAKHKLQPRLMTFLIKAYNVVDKQGPMSITTKPSEYRTRFLEMCRGIIEVR